MKKKYSDWFSFYAPRFLCLTLVLGFLVRLILAFHPLTVVDWGVAEWLKIFGLGIVNDVAFTAIALVPAFVFYTLLSEVKYRKPVSYILLGLLAALTVYVVFFNDITDEYGSVVPLIANILLILLLVCFALKLFIPGIRKGWRKAAVWTVMMLYSVCAVSIAFSEVVFWSEFGVRFNFIAVDYLVYTNEVIGNIVESYPMVPMVGAMLLVSAFICFLMTRRADISEAGVKGPACWSLNLAALAVAALAGGFFLHYGYRNLESRNLYATQLHQNGCWDFLEAYASNELDYRQFYKMLPQEEAEALQRELCGMDSTGKKTVAPGVEELHKNVVLITIESMSADFMARYGNEKGLTPCLDSISAAGLCFDRLFATGNRTVRGLEAVTLCIPPSSGESLVKRPDCGGLFSTGSLFAERGYSVRYIYGGDSYFDNMGAFFGGNGYEIVDKKDYGKDRVTFSNIWGTCDEDTYSVALDLFDADAAAGKPFFAHIMTISNHRPYTYPEGRIEFDGNPMCRDAAVKYTDYAIGKFLSDASLKPWFKETVFVILADHCASSAGKTSLPLDCYHIPALVYSPGFIAPQAVDKVCSQIDLMPTVLSLLGFSYESEFYGRDILSTDFPERAFMATYQDLGYYSRGTLTVLSPVRKMSQFSVSEESPWHWAETPLDMVDETGEKEAEAYYQTANLKFAKK